MVKPHKPQKPQSQAGKHKKIREKIALLFYVYIVRNHRTKWVIFFHSTQLNSVTRGQMAGLLEATVTYQLGSSTSNLFGIGSVGELGIPVSDVVKFKNEGSLAEQLCFQACRQIDRQIDRSIYRQIDRWTTTTSNVNIPR